MAIVINEYGCTETPQKVTLKQGTHIIECWGGSGGRYNNVESGLGGYTKGTLTLTSPLDIWLYVGGKGLMEDEGMATTGYSSVFLPGGWNGGGQSYQSTIRRGSGGGASDVRLINGTWDDFDSLKSRIMVAAGAGGLHNSATAGYNHGGGLLGTRYDSAGGSTSVAATQTSPGTNQYDATNIPARFGKGFSMIASTTVMGGGSGYYGGCVGGGGSSFISGHTGCDAINITASTSETNMVHKGNPNHDSGIIFTDTQTETGVNLGDGKIIITSDETGKELGEPKLIDKVYNSDLELVSKEYTADDEYALVFNGSASGYINTNITPNQNTGVYYDILFDVISGASNHAVGCFASTGRFYAPYINDGGSVSAGWNDLPQVLPLGSVKTGQWYRASLNLFNNKKAIFGDGEIDIIGTPGTGLASAYIGRHRGGTGYLTGKLRRVIMTQNNNIILDGIPVPAGSKKYSSTAAPANTLWDVVNQVYMPVSSGTIGIIKIPTQKIDKVYVGTFKED